MAAFDDSADGFSDQKVISQEEWELIRDDLGKGLENVRAIDLDIKTRIDAQKAAYRLPMEKRAEFWRGSRWETKLSKKTTKPKASSSKSNTRAVAVEPTASCAESVAKEAAPEPEPRPSRETAIPPAPDRAVMLTHLGWLFGNARGKFDDALIEIAYDTRGDGVVNKALLFELNKIEDAASFAEGENKHGSNVYVGVALKKPKTPRYLRTNADAFLAGFVIPCDIDEDAERTNAKLDAIATAGAIVTTGTIPELRQQKWYGLREPCTDALLFATAFERLVTHVGGDMSALGAARIMRLAGSVSYPSPKKLARGYVTEMTKLVINEDAPSITIETFAALVPCEEPSASRSPPRQVREPAGDDFFRIVNDRAIADLEAWVPELFGEHARPQRSGGYRVSSKALGRDLEEDLSLHPEGIKDFGVHDMGDPQEGRRSPIDVVMEHGDRTVKEAALWLCEKLGTDPQEVGWRGTVDEGFGECETPPTGEMVIIDPWEKYPLPPFPLEVLPPVLRDYVANQAEVIGCDKSALAMSTLCAISGAISHEMKLRMNHHDDTFKVSPCLWVLLVGDPGIQKSPIISSVIAPLVKRQREEMRAYLDDLRAWEECKSDDKGPRPIEPPGYLIFDTTPEALCAKLSLSRRGIFTIADELSGLLGQMERYGGGSSASRATWLLARNGGYFQTSRITRRSDVVENLSSSLLGGIQPKRLAEIPGLDSDGFLQRFIPVLMRPGKLGQDVQTGPSVARFDNLVQQCIAAPATTLTMTDAALARMRSLRGYFQKLTDAADAISAGFQAFVSKLTGVAGNLALILHVAKNPAASDAQVDQETIIAVERIIKSFVIPHAEEFYAAGAGVGNDRIRRIASYILISGKKIFNPSDFTKNVAPLVGLDVFDLKRAVSPLVAGGWLEMNDKRPSAPRWTLAPGVTEQMEERRQEREQANRALAELMGSRRRPH